jgi:hypothetical protein
MRIFIDESGFTGEDLFNAQQPMFTVASTNLSDDETGELWKQLFPKSKAREIKHSALVRDSRGQALAVELIRHLATMPTRSTVYVAHKRFCLLSKIVDLWVEPAMHGGGVDLYEGGGNIALANLLYFTLKTLNRRRFDVHLSEFQQMIRERTLEAYADFWSTIYMARKRSKKDIARVLDFFLVSEDQLGFPHLLHLPSKCLDICFAVALGIITHWRELTNEPLSVVHDGSSNMAKEKWLWDAIVSPDVPEQLVGFDVRTTKFPLGVTETVFADSTIHRQLQICDVLSGATATWAASLARLGRPDRTSYCKELESAGIKSLLAGSIWPVPEVKRLKTHPDQEKMVDPLRFFAEIASSAKKNKQ